MHLPFYRSSVLRARKQVGLWFTFRSVEDELSFQWRSKINETKNRGDATCYVIKWIDDNAKARVERGKQANGYSSKWRECKVWWLHRRETKEDWINVTVCLLLRITSKNELPLAFSLFSQPYCKRKRRCTNSFINFDILWSIVLSRTFDLFSNV